MKTDSYYDENSRGLRIYGSDSESLDSSANDDYSLYMEQVANHADWRRGTPVPKRNVFSLVQLFVQSLGQWGSSLVKTLSNRSAYWRGMVRPPTAMIKALEGSGRCDGSHPTQYLDGIRGIACFIVFNFHFLYPYTITIFRGFGAPNSDGYYHYVHQLPYISLIYRGRAMVLLFFALSGYVLSFKCLTLIRKQDWEESQKTLSSLTLRRFARLYVPPTISMFVVMIATFYGAFEPGRRFQSSEWRTGYPEHHPVRKATFSAQAEDFTKLWCDWTNLWNWNPYFNNYDPHTWTIPLELRSSMVLFVMLVIRMRLRLIYGFLLTLMAAFYCLLTVRWDVAIFLGGALVADMHISTSTKKQILSPRFPGTTKGSLPKSNRLTLSKIGLRFALLLALYLLCYPDDDGHQTPGYKLLASWAPSVYYDKRVFWNVIAGFVLMWCIGRDRLLVSFFETDIAQYLGKVSYAFYLTHGPLLHSIGFTLQPMIWRILGHKSLCQWLFGLFVGWLIMLTLCLVVAHFFWRYIDMPLVKMTKRIEKAISVSS